MLSATLLVGAIIILAFAAGFFGGRGRADRQLREKADAAASEAEREATRAESEATQRAATAAVDTAWRAAEPDRVKRMREALERTWKR